MPIIKERRTRWGKMGKSHIPTSSLVDQYILTCRTEGKTFSTIRAGQSRLNRPQVWDSGSLGSDESRKSFDLYVL